MGVSNLNGQCKTLGRETAIVLTSSHSKQTSRAKHKLADVPMVPMLTES